MGDDGDDGGPGDGGGTGGGGAPSAAITVAADCADGLCRALTGVPVRFENASTGDVRQLRWDFGDGVMSRGAAANHAWSSPGFYEVTLWVSDGTTESTAALKFLVEASEPAGSCRPDGETLCLQDSRYAVGVEWRTADGASGAGKVVREGTNDLRAVLVLRPGRQLGGPHQGPGRLRTERERMGVRRVHHGPRLRDPGDRHGHGRRQGVPQRAGPAGARDHGRDRVPCVRPLTAAGSMAQGAASR